MRLTVRFLGLDLLDVELTTEAAVAEDDTEDLARDLSGGTLSCDRIDPGPTPLYMGFTSGFEADE